MLFNLLFPVAYFITSILIMYLVTVLLEVDRLYHAMLLFSVYLVASILLLIFQGGLL